MTDTDLLLDVLLAIRDELPRHEADLNRLDAALGDGDHGLTITRACRSIGEAADGLSSATVATALRTVGMAVVSKAGGASGALLGAAFLAAAEMPDGVASLDPADVAAMLERAQDAVGALGRTELGDKTMLDALAPAAWAARRSADAGRSIEETIRAAAEAARAGANATRDMIGRAGRAGRLGERSRGHPDPGAESVALMFEVAARRLTEVGR